MTELIWQDPPPTVYGKSDVQEIVAELKKNPGKWALVRQNAASGLGQSFRRAGCKTKYRSIKGPDGKGSRNAAGTQIVNVYAMWPGELDA